MNEESKELEQVEQIRAEMEEIRRMLEEIKENTTYFKQFMEKYNIPMQEETRKDRSVLPEPEMKAESNQKKQIKAVAPKL